MSLRPVEVNDVEALLALRAGLYGGEMGTGTEPVWIGACRQVLLDGLATGDITGVIALADDGTPVGSALARVTRWLPSPGNPTGLKGYIGSLATPADDGEQVANEILEHLVGLLTARGITEIAIHADEATAEVALGLGFVEAEGTVELTRIVPAPLR